MTTDGARGVLAQVAAHLRQAQQEEADDAALAAAFGMVAARAQYPADGAASTGESPGTGSRDPLDVLATVWGLLRSRPLPEYPPEVAMLALWLLDLSDMVCRRAADDLNEEGRHVL